MICCCISILQGCFFDELKQETILSCTIFQEEKFTELCAVPLEIVKEKAGGNKNLVQNAKDIAEKFTLLFGKFSDCDKIFNSGKQLSVDDIAALGK